MATSLHNRLRVLLGALLLAFRCAGASQALSVLPACDRAAAEGWTFSTGSLNVATAPWLTATQGQVDVTCQMPADWPRAADAMLFHAQSAPHVHATLFFREGVLRAVYKGGEASFSSLAAPEAQRWPAGSWHRIQFAWRPSWDEEQEELAVELTLWLDGKPAGIAFGRVMAPWPVVCEVGGRNGVSLWPGRIRGATFSTATLVPPGLTPGERTVTVQADRLAGECYRFWTVANCNGPHRFMNPKHAEGINRGQPFISEINAVYLLGGRYTDQNVWYRGLTPDGELDVDFSGMIAQLQAMLDGGFTPWVVLDKTPHAMCRSPQANTYGNTEPPDDVRVWARYVEAALRAMVAAFGPERVGQWWFRVGTEPDLYPGHWTGTREQYLELYDHTVAAVTRVVPGVRIGPGNILNPRDGQFGTKTRGLWGLGIIDHAACGTNAVTGGVGTRMDWFSCSWYARVGRPLSDFDEAVNLMRDRLARYPALRETPLVIGEFAVLHDENGRRLWSGDTTEWAASLYAGLADRVYRYGVRRVYEWAQTTDGVPHPRTQVIAMLDRMAGGQRVEAEVASSSAAECGAVACRKDGELFVLLYNHRGQRRPKVPETVRLVLRDRRMKAGDTWQLGESRIDAEHAAWAYAFAADCRAAGLKPLPTAGRHEGGVSLLYGPAGVEVFRKNRARYERLSRLEEEQARVTVGPGVFERAFEMPGHSVRLLRLRAP